MPLKRCTLPNGELGWKCGDGACHASKASAERESKQRPVKKADTGQAGIDGVVVQKANPYHDENGKFTTKDKARSGGASEVSVATGLMMRAASKSKSEAEIVKEVLTDQQKKDYDQIVIETKKAIGDGLTSNIMHSKNGDGTGGYTAERQKLHDAILREMLREAKAFKAPDGTTPTVIFLGGRGGSGKSQFKKEVNSDVGVYSDRDFYVLDPDEVKKRLPEYDPSKAFLHHEESGHLSDRFVAMARRNRINMVLDVTMKSSKDDWAFHYKQAGYRVEAHYMFVPPTTAATRALKRWVEGDGSGRYGRLVPPSVILSNTNNEKNFDRLASKADHWSVFRNDGAAPQFVSAKARE